MPSLRKNSQLSLFILYTLVGLMSWNFLFDTSVYAAPSVEPTLAEQTVLIHFAENATDDERHALIADIEGELVNWLPQIGVAEVRLATTGETAQALIKGNAAEIAQKRWQATGRHRLLTQLIENNVVVEGTYQPNDPDLNNQQRSYPLQTTRTLQGWDYTRGDSTVVIAVLDSGINFAHPEFGSRLLPGYDFVNDDNDPSDDHGHGTHTAGIIAAGIDNELGMVGVCPECTILPVKVLNQNNAGTWSGVAQGILYATDQGARVISLSLGAAVSSKTLEAAVDYATEHNVLVIAAAGNMGVDRKFYPAALENVMAVSATDGTDQRWALSNMGAYIDVAAPGHAVYSTYNDLGNYYSGYNYMSGTSMAAPHVAGLAGLLISQKPERTIANLYQIITSTADKLTQSDHDSYFGYGRINVERALTLEMETQPATEEAVIDAEQPATAEEQATTTSEQPIQAIYMPLIMNP
jgi:thermitase